MFYFPLLSQLTSYVLFASRTRSCTHLRLVMHSLCHFLPKILQRGCLISSLALVVPYPLPFPPQNKATTPTCIHTHVNTTVMFTRTEPKRGFAGKNTAMMTVPEPYTTCKTVGVWDIGGEVRDRWRMQQNQCWNTIFCW